MKYKKAWKRLVEEARTLGLKVKLVGNSTLHDYAAMNPEAAKVMGFPDTTYILIDRNLPMRSRCESLDHELEEYRRMRFHGEPYWPAHLYALKNEKDLVWSR